MTKLRPIVLAAVLMTVASMTFAQIPQNIAYQGYLTQDSQPFTGSIPASFTLWDAQSGGIQAWNQQQQSVQVTNGYYTVMLDFSKNWQNPYTTFNHQYWLEVLINGTTIGRVQLAASPYAMNSRIADSAIHIPQSPVGTIVAFGGDALKLRGLEKQLGWYVCDGRRIPRDSFPEYERMVGATYGLSDNTDSLYLPDFRCLFLRGVDGGMTGGRPAADSLKDPDEASRFAIRDGANDRNKVGSVQADAVGPHQHIIPTNSSIAGPGGAMYGLASIAKSGAVSGTNGNGGATLTSIPNPTDASQYTPNFPIGRTSSETRPKNAYVYWLIKVR